MNKFELEKKIEHLEVILNDLEEFLEKRFFARAHMRLRFAKKVIEEIKREGQEDYD